MSSTLFRTCINTSITILTWESENYLKEKWSSNYQMQEIDVCGINVGRLLASLDWRSFPQIPPLLRTFSHKSMGVPYILSQKGSYILYWIMEHHVWKKTIAMLMHSSSRTLFRGVKASSTSSVHRAYFINISNTKYK